MISYRIIIGYKWPINLFIVCRIYYMKNDPKETYKLINKLLDREYGSNKLPNDKDDETIAKNFSSFFD